MGFIHSYVFENGHASGARGQAPGGQAGKVPCAVVWEVPASFHHARSHHQHLLSASRGHYRQGWASSDEERSSALTEGGEESRCDSGLAECRSIIEPWQGVSSKWQASCHPFLCCPLQKQWPRSPCLGFPSITCMLCRDLLYVSIGLRDCFSLQCFGELEVEWDKKKAGELLP